MIKKTSATLGDTTLPVVTIEYTEEQNKAAERSEKAVELYLDRLNKEEE